MAPKGKKLRRIEAPKYLEENWGIRRSAKTLAKLATVGGGPKYYKSGRECLYDPADLDEWAASTLGTAMSSTSECRDR